MSWLCEICSTINEDDNTECFVCGHERSKESYREARRAKRQVIYNMIGNFLISKVFLGIKILLICLSVMLFAGALISIIANDVYESFPGNALRVWDHICNNVGVNFIDRTKILMACVAIKIQVNTNCLPIFEIISANVASALTLQQSIMIQIADITKQVEFFKMLSENAKINFSYTSNLILAISANFSGHQTQIADLFNLIAQKHKQ